MLRTFSFGTGSPRLLITGAVHGDEFEPIAAIHQLIHQLSQERGELLTRGTVTLIPVVNEPAFLRGHRCGDDGLDLARTFPGRSEGTATERIAWELSEQIRHTEFYIDLHTGGTELCVTPLSGYMMHPKAAVLDAQRRMARAFNLPVIWGTSAALNGRSLSVARDANVPAIYCEYLGSAVCSRSGVEACLSGCLNVMRDLGMTESPAPPDSVRCIIEDTRPNSGHMQICNPAPCDGFFATSLKPGDMVSAGQPIGQVFPLENPLQPVTMTAQQSGILLVLRTFPRVRAGDSVGVIVTIPAGD